MPCVQKAKLGQCDAVDIVRLGSGTDVKVTFTRATFTVADHVHDFMAAVFPVGSGLFQQNIAPCYTAKRAAYTT